MRAPHEVILAFFSIFKGISLAYALAKKKRGRNSEDLLSIIFDP
jgi:hypothetical protein